MAESFASLKQELEAACESLRQFTLAKPGFSEKDGVAGIELVTGLCDRMKSFTPGSKSAEATSAVVVGRNCVVAAQTRLNLLRRKRRA